MSTTTKNNHNLQLFFPNFSDNQIIKKTKKLRKFKILYFKSEYQQLSLFTYGDNSCL